MTKSNRQAHWHSVYANKGEQEVSWFEERPEISLALIDATGVAKDAAIIDVGGGASRLVDALLDRGFADITVLDLSKKAIETSQARLGARGKAVQWVIADATTWQPLRRYDVWHDRAAFHFLTEPEDREAYARQVARTVRTGGHVIIGTFALDGPERCSGLPIVRYDAAMIADILGPAFELVESRRHDHHTPAGAIQRFQFSRFQRVK
jgi:SAM-dependent methyltransferase